MRATKIPVTPAIRLLRAQQVRFEPHPYDYVEKGGTAHSAASLGVPEHSVIKTLVMQDDAGRPLLVLMHGDRRASTRNLARQIGARSVSPCTPDVAQKHSGYQVGGTSPFGTRKPLPVYAEASIFELDRIYLNGGKRGLLVSLAPQELDRVLAPTRVNVAVDP
jgi:Cys-tRNA(Pro) deacylase